MDISWFDFDLDEIVDVLAKLPALAKLVELEPRCAYLSLLAEQGYTLSAVEQLVVNGGTKPKRLSRLFPQRDATIG